GEVVLVVFGILIALQIDNWNEGRKQEVLEIQFLKSIKKDLISDTLYLNRRIKDSEKLISNHYQYIHNVYEVQKDSKEFKELADLLWFNSEHFAPQNSTFFEILNSGQLNIFKNGQLKDDFISLYNDYDIASSAIKEYNEFTATELTKINLTFLKYWEPFSYIFDETYPFNDAEWRYINDTNTQEFKTIEKLAALYSNKLSKFLFSFIELKSKVKLIINDIERELEKRD
ncbi:MAG: hypothetical protein KAK04_21605, partial [Cyclobacteriaceae bacterium]|nr:hypothetical protein [Cyclobacteriaceae bacterium]